ncbi:MAG: DUF819 family protein, partial [Pseudomonadales bacterium]|nr:DUF819 family protein [Pseudomonadales bacterium]
MSLISPNETLQIAGILTGLAAFGFWVETTAIGRKASGVLIILCLGVLLSNIQIIPHSADAYGVVGSMLVPLAIPMLLFRADLKQVFAEVGPMLKAFIASALVIAVSIIVLTLAFDFGEYESKVAGTLAGSYIGGSLNFVATAQAVQLDDPNHYVAALTADTIGAVLFLILLMVMPALAFVRRLMPSRYYSESGVNLGTEAGQQETASAKPFDIAGLAAAMATSFIICALADLISAKLGQESYSILIITILALLVANFMKPLVKRFNSEFEVGTFFMYMFFVTIGAGADVATIAGVALPYVVLICIAVAMFFVLILVVGRVLRLDLAELMVAANACILGPATAAALAAGQGWKDL